MSSQDELNEAASILDLLQSSPVASLAPTMSSSPPSTISLGGRAVPRSQGGEKGKGKRLTKKRTLFFDVKYEISDGNDEEGGFFSKLDARKFPKVAAEFPEPEWRVLRSHDGHYKVSNVVNPKHLYTSLSRARAYKEFLLQQNQEPEYETFVSLDSDYDEDDNYPRTFSTTSSLSAGYGYNHLPMSTIAASPPPPPRPVQHKSTTLHSYGALMSLVSPCQLIIYRGTHKDIPTDTESVQYAHRKDKMYVKFGFGDNHQVLFFSAGCIHGGAGRAELFEEWENDEDEEETKGEVPPLTEKVCKRCGDSFFPLDRPRSCLSAFCDACEQQFGGMRVHYYAEASQKRINKDRKRRRVVSREEGTKGDVMISECGSNCPLCPKDFEPPVVCVPATRPSDSPTEGSLPLYGNLKDDGFVVLDTNVPKFVNYTDLAKATAPFTYSKGKTTSSGNGWSVIFNNENQHMTGGPTQSNAKGSRRQMNLDITRNPSLFSKVGGVTMLANLCDQVASDFGKTLEDSVELRVMNPVFLHTEIGTPEQDAHRDWKRSACIGDTIDES